MFDLNQINGKKIYVDSIKITYDKSQLKLFLSASTIEVSFAATFFGVSRVTFENFSFPMEICGFEIISHQGEGWAQDSRFEIRDYEDGKVSFYCQSYDIQEQ